MTKRITDKNRIRPSKEVKKTKERKDPVYLKLDSEDHAQVVGNFKEIAKSLYETTGSRNYHAANKLFQQVVSVSHRNEESMNGAVAMLWDIQPSDAVEGLLASQMVAVHNMAMEVAKRAIHENRSVQGVQENVNLSVKLMRTFVAQVEALKKYRVGGTQTIQVQHVNVNEGGQAIVGNVKGGGGEK